jgi:hypothetical protein
MKPVDNTKKYRKYTSIAITVGIVLMLILSGPVSAVSVTISGLSGSQSYGTQTFNVDITIDGDDKFVPITNLSLDITGARTQTCVFSLDGTPISGDDGVTITQISAPSWSGGVGVGYGYDSRSDCGYNFPHGYGYASNYGAGGGSITYTYQITFLYFPTGDYNVVANLNTGAATHPAFSSSAADFYIVSSGGGGSGSGTLPTTTDVPSTEDETVSDETVETPIDTEPVVTKPTDDETTTPISTPVADGEEEEEETSWLPGFESIFAVAGLLAVAAFAKLQKRRD